MSAAIPRIKLLLASSQTDRANYDFFAVHNYEVTRANSVQNALEHLSNNSFDFMMLNSHFFGNELSSIEELRDQSQLAHISFFIYSNKNCQKSREAAFELGADDYFDFALPEHEIIWRLRFHQQMAQRARRLQSDLRQTNFLVDLGQALLATREPEQMINHLATKIYQTTGATLCAVAAEFSGSGVPTAVAVLDRAGVADNASEICADRLQKWLRREAGNNSRLLENFEEFLFSTVSHACEYIAPLTIGDRTLGILVVGFNRASDCTPMIRALIDAAAAYSAPAVNFASLYDAALSASIYLAKEEEKKFTEAILNALPVSLYAIDRDYRIVAWNRLRELGERGVLRENVMGRNVFEVLPRQPRRLLESEFERAFATGRIERVEHKTIDDQGAIKHWLISKIPMRDALSGEVLHVISLGEDITARVEANYAVARAEKLAAVGRLAAGIVHEINNPLATIAACAEVLENRTGEGVFESDLPEAIADLREYLILIRSEAFRCKSITNGLLDFSRARSGHRAALNIADVVRSSANLVAHQKRGEDIEIRVETADNLPPISADEGQIQQAIIALATNAIDAMPMGGCLTFRVFQKRRRVVIEIADTGNGISSENIIKIFDPFFTTKEVGRGTGLGLAVCYGIVTEHGGSLSVRSTLGSGSTFTISLPIKSKT